jgi:hypothetical protein
MQEEMSASKFNAVILVDPFCYSFFSFKCINLISKHIFLFFFYHTILDN